MTHRTSRALVRHILLATVGIVGCNAILDNTPGELRQSASGQTPTSETFATCPSREHLCDGRCVDDDDPEYGCGDPSCEPCSDEGTGAVCRNGRCSPKACEPGHADCNRSRDDGCEADLSRAKTCGDCDTKCPADKPLCSPTDDGGFSCTSGCPGNAPERCDDECVSTSSSPNHCGGCHRKCPAVTNGTAECTNGACGFACKSGYHACADQCLKETDPDGCGPTCTVCPVPPNATATCASNACGMACKTGFGDCNKNANDGCEAAFATDAANCGGCGKACDGGTCRNGLCSD